MIMADNKDKKVLNVPALRFPEFSREWKRHKLSEICSFYSGGTPSSSKKEFYNGNIPFIRSGELHKDKTELFITEDGLNSSAAKLVEIGDLLLALYGATSGDIAISKIKGAINQAILCIRTKQNKKFIESVWNKHVERLLQTYLQGGQGNLSADIVKNIPFYFADLEEQDKLANFISLLDERISTQNKIIEDLKKLKSAISKHLFARKDLLETTICLSNIATLKNGYAFQSSKYNALGKWKILTITNVSGERYINDEDCNCIINLPNDIQDHQVLKEGDILISLTGNVGRVSLCKNGDYLLNQRVGLLQLAKNVNQEFLYQILSSQKFENSMIACGQGAAQMNIGKGDVESYVLPYSSNGNNILWVAKILHSYDECIINEMRRLTLLTMQKQYLLTQMFI
jgi:type I restriction enzyme S subunit